MQTELSNLIDSEADPLATTQAIPTVATLPASLGLTERGASLLREFLVANGLADYRVYHSPSMDLHDIDSLLKELGETEAAWELPDAFGDGGEAVSQLDFSGSKAYGWPNGFLRLFRHRAVIARWHWMSTSGYSDGRLTLIAAPSIDALSQLRAAVVQARRRSNVATWQIIGESENEEKPKRLLPADGSPSLVLNEAILDRIRAEVLRFFTPEVQTLYGELDVPYRRGVLLHGPPGNGKTSIIRWIGASLPQVAAMSLRAWQGFDADDLTRVIKQWTAQAPALLVLEDLDWLLQQVNVSTFLNQLDGLSTPPTGGLMLIATTNHPEKLDPAVNNRPGRFDATIELPKPDDALRERFLRAKLAMLADADLLRAIVLSDGLSFSHLQETLRLSGLRALHAGRSSRTSEDVLSALADLKATHENAVRGFPPATPTIPFGLAAMHKQK